MPETVRDELRLAKRTHKKIETACVVIILVSTIFTLIWLFMRTLRSPDHSTLLVAVTRLRILPSATSGFLWSSAAFCALSCRLCLAAIDGDR